MQSELGFPAEALEALNIGEAIPPLPSPALPPYNGYGTLDDSKQNCIALVPKPPKKVRGGAHDALGKLLAVIVHGCVPPQCASVVQFACNLPWQGPAAHEAGVPAHTVHLFGLRQS